MSAQLKTFKRYMLIAFREGYEPAVFETDDKAIAYAEANSAASNGAAQCVVFERKGVAYRNGKRLPIVQQGERSFTRASLENLEYLCEREQAIVNKPKKRSR